MAVIVVLPSAGGVLKTRWMLTNPRHREIAHTRSTPAFVENAVLAAMCYQTVFIAKVNHLFAAADLSNHDDFLNADVLHAILNQYELIQILGDAYGPYSDPPRWLTMDQERPHTPPCGCDFLRVQTICLLSAGIVILHCWGPAHGGAWHKRRMSLGAR